MSDLRDDVTSSSNPDPKNVQDLTVHVRIIYIEVT